MLPYLMSSHLTFWKMLSDGGIVLDKYQRLRTICIKRYVDGLLQDCSISSALAMEILQSCTKPTMCSHQRDCWWPGIIWRYGISSQSDNQSCIQLELAFVLCSSKTIYSPSHIKIEIIISTKCIRKWHLSYFRSPFVSDAIPCWEKNWPVIIAIYR